ncbi:MBL fold metallo-hydrolase [Roseivirga pacifica]
MRAPLIILIAVCFSSALKADYVKVSRDAVIRAEGNSSATIIERVEAGTLLPLLSNELIGTGYLKVTTPLGKTGFIYKSWVRIIKGDIPAETITPQTTNELTTSGNLEVHVINVGQGDAIIIRCPDGNHEMLIDAAELNAGFRYPGSQTEFRNYISAFQQENNPIEVAISTHPHSDHIAGMSWVLSEYQVSLYVDNGMKNTSGTYGSLEQKIIDANINRKQLNDSVIPDIDFCPREDVNARILRPAGYDEEGMDPNDYSVIVRVDYGGSSFLFTGDAEREMEHKLMNDPETAALLDVDFLKVGHHGSHSSSDTTFLNVVTPTIAAISCGAETVGTNVSHKHPRMVTVNNLIPYLGQRNGMETSLEAYNRSSGKWEVVSSKAALYITNNDGDLIFLSDGSEIWRRGDR